MSRRKGLITVVGGNPVVRCVTPHCGNVLIAEGVGRGHDRRNKLALRAQNNGWAIAEGWWRCPKCKERMEP